MRDCEDDPTLEDEAGESGADETGVTGVLWREALIESERGAAAAAGGGVIPENKCSTTPTPK